MPEQPGPENGGGAGEPCIPILSQTAEKHKILELNGGGGILAIGGAGLLERQIYVNIMTVKILDVRLPAFFSWSQNAADLGGEYEIDSRQGDK